MKKWLPLAYLFLGVFSLVILFGAWDILTRAENGKLDVLDTVGGDFTLTNGEGNRVGLKDFQGKPLLMFFGYTACPDICPTTMIMLQKVKKALGPDGDKLNYLFITLDPERDGPEEVSKYAKFWDPSFIGLTGTMDEIKDVTKKFRAFFKKKDSGSAAGYLVAHTDVIYLLDGKGRTRGLYQLTDPVEKVTQDIQSLL